MYIQNFSNLPKNFYNTLKLNNITEGVNACPFLPKLLTVAHFVTNYHAYVEITMSNE